MKAYRILDPMKQLVRIVRDVVFDKGRGWVWDKVVDDGSTSTINDFVVEYLHFDGAGGAGNSSSPSVPAQALGSPPVLASPPPPTPPATPHSPTPTPCTSTPEPRIPTPAPASPGSAPPASVCDEHRLVEFITRTTTANLYSTAPWRTFSASSRCLDLYHMPWR
jgi:hypothetical protein